MKKLKLFTLGLLGGSMFLTSCADDNDDPDAVGPSLVITEMTSGSTGGDVTITQGQSLTFVWDARRGDADLETFAVATAGVNTANPVPTSEQGNDFPYDIANADDETYLDTLVFSNAGLNTGQTSYTFTVTDRDGVETEKVFNVTVESAATPMNNETTGAFFHIGGSSEGAYDLVAEGVVAASQPDANKDMENTDMAGATFTGSWAAANSTMFVKANSFDYANATVEAAATAYAAGTATASVSNPADNDIYIAKLRGGNNFAVVTITDVDPTDNTCNCGNTGKISFNFKKQ